MCGIAGLIHKGKSSNVGGEMTAMLQALKHRGPDSTGYAVYGSQPKATTLCASKWQKPKICTKVAASIR